MIRVKAQPEPVDFEQKVKRLGEKFLIETPNPQNWGNREYWRRCLVDLWKAYDGICAFTCHWIAPDTGNASVEHFIPKSLAPQRAYDWSNFRLVCSRLNGRKGDFQDVLDPFLLQDEWFVLKFPDLKLMPNPKLSEEEKTKVKSTISRLKLNDDRTCVNARYDYLLAYCREKITFEYLQEKAPFIAYELKRQKLVDVIHTMIPTRFLTNPPT